MIFVQLLPASRWPLLAAITHGLHEQAFEVLLSTDEFIQLCFAQDLLQLRFVLPFEIKSFLLKLQLSVSIQMGVGAIIMRIITPAQLCQIMAIAIVYRPKLS